MSWHGLALTVLAGLALVLVFVNIALYGGSRDLQDAINAKQQTINQGMVASRLNQQLIGALANLAGQTGDAEIHNLLAEQGITYTVTPPAGTGGGETGTTTGTTEGGG